MNRDIEFRGKVIASYNGSDGKWVYGDFFRDGTAVKIKEFVKATFSVDPETVGQFTGLTDKNGVKIFEGDIIRYANMEARSCTEPVFYDSKYAYFKIKNLQNRLDDKSLYYGAVHCGGCEVIGNIHDNPELLEGEKHE